MAIIPLKAWYLKDYEPIQELEKRPHDLRLNRNSLLKSALRADFLEESQEVKQSAWFQRYLEGESVEFYVEGSGGYTIANIDLSSHEIYFTKQTVMAQLEPTIFLCYQTEYAASSEALRDGLQHSLETLNPRSRLPLTLVESQRPQDAPLRLSRTMMRSIRQSLLFIADSTVIARTEGKENYQLIPSPNVCIEIGYALQSKRSEQILLVQMERGDLSGELPFDLPNYQFLRFQAVTELPQVLPQLLETQLKRFNLFA